MNHSSILTSSYTPIVLGVSYGFMYVVLIWALRRRAKRNYAFKRTVTGLQSIFSCPEIEHSKPTERVAGLYDFLSSRYGSQFTRYFSSPIEMVTNVVYLLETHCDPPESDSLGAKSTGGHPLSEWAGRLASLPAKAMRPGPSPYEVIGQIENQSEFLRFCMGLAATMRKEDPFAGVSGRHASLLKAISDAVERENKEMAENSLDQLSKNIENLESNIRHEQNRNATSTWVSVVGIVLTLVFGGLSLVQYVQSPSVSRPGDNRGPEIDDSVQTTGRENHLVD